MKKVTQMYSTKVLEHLTVSEEGEVSPPFFIDLFDKNIASFMDEQDLDDIKEELVKVAQGGAVDVEEKDWSSLKHELHLGFALVKGVLSRASCVSGGRSNFSFAYAKAKEEKKRITEFIPSVEELIEDIKN